MAEERQPSVDPHRLVLGAGTADYRADYTENYEVREKQLWFLEDSQGDVIDIHQYHNGDWRSLLEEYVTSVSGIEGVDGDVPQVVAVEGPAPDSNGEERQFGYDPNREEIFVYHSGIWHLIGSVESASGATTTHALDPSSNQVSDPSSAPTVSTSATSSGSLSAGDYKWLVTYVTPWGETAKGPASNSVTASSGDQGDLTDIPTSSNDVVEDRNIYRTEAGGETLYYVDNIGDNTSTSYTDTTADADLGSDTAPTENKTEAHSGSLPESNVSFDSSAGHNHDGANSRKAIVQTHDIAGDKHSGNLSYTDLIDVPSKFTPEDHDVNPGEGPHTGGLPWSQLENVPALASDPHTNEAHENDFALAPHNNDQHSETYLTSAMERIRYGAGQLGNISAKTNLQPPVPIDVAGSAVKIYALSRVAPDSNVSATVYVKDSEHGEYFTQTVTLPSGNTMEVDSSISGTTIYDESQVRFSLNDSDSTGEDFGIYLIVETEIGS